MQRHRESPRVISRPRCGIVGVICLREVGAIMLLVAAVLWVLMQTGLQTSALTTKESAEHPGPIHRLVADGSGRELWLNRRNRGLFRRALTDGGEEQVLPRRYPLSDVAVFAGESDAVCAVTRFDSILEIWRNGRIVLEHRLDDREDWMRSPSFADCGRTLAAISYRGRLFAWRLSGTEYVLQLDRRIADVLEHVTVSNDGRFAACASNNRNILVWDLWQDRLAASWETPHIHCSGLCWSPDGAALATIGSGGRLCVWDAGRGRLRWQTVADVHDPSAVVFTPDGDRVITGGFDRRVRIWDASNGGLLAEYQGHEDGIRALALSPDGDRVHSGDLDGRVLSWPL